MFPKLLRAHGYPGEILYAIFAIVKTIKKIRTTIYDIDVPMINNSLHWVFAIIREEDGASIATFQSHE